MACNHWRRKISHPGKLILAFAAVITIGIPRAALGNVDRLRQSLDAGWRFRVDPTSTLDQKADVTDWTWSPALENETLDRTPKIDGDPSQPGYDDSAWRTVNVPHDYLIEQPFTKGLDVLHASLPTPSAWYRKTIVIPTGDKNRDYWLDFDGIYRDSKIY